MEYEQYGKLQPPRRRGKDIKEGGKNMNEEKKEEAEPKGFINRFVGSGVKLKLVDGEVLSGRLNSNSHNKFDVLLETGKGAVLIPKHGIIWIKEDENKE